MNYHDIITIGPGKRGGKPCVRGLRSTAYDVLDPGFRRGDDGWAGVTMNGVPTCVIPAKAGIQRGADGWCRSDNGRCRLMQSASRRSH